LKSQRSLTSVEEKELKKQRRLIKNREYASQSRSRKKLFVDDLQKKFDVIQQENVVLKRQIHSVTTENILLKKQLEAIATTIKRSNATNNNHQTVNHPTVNHTTIHHPTMMHQPMHMQAGNFFTIGRAAPVKTAACLLAVMFMIFTFGLIMEKETKLTKGLFPGGKSLHLNTRVILADIDEYSNDFIPPPIPSLSFFGNHLKRNPPLINQSTSLSIVSNTTFIEDLSTLCYQDEGYHSFCLASAA